MIILLSSKSAYHLQQLDRSKIYSHNVYSYLSYFFMSHLCCTYPILQVPYASLMFIFVISFQFEPKKSEANVHDSCWAGKIWPGNSKFGNLECSHQKVSSETFMDCVESRHIEHLDTITITTTEFWGKKVAKDTTLITLWYTTELLVSLMEDHQDQKWQKATATFEV